MVPASRRNRPRRSPSAHPTHPRESTREPARVELENVAKMEKQKADCMKRIDEMAAALEEARPHLTEAQLSEVVMRFDWFRHFAIWPTVDRAPDR